MTTIRSFFSKIGKKLKKNTDRQLITLYPEHNNSKGRVLFSYLKDPLLWKQNDERFQGHSNKWESREIANLFLNKGYIVDAIDFNDNLFHPRQKYEIIFDICDNLQRLTPSLEPNILKIMHLTGSYPRFQNNAEMKRVKDLEWRRKAVYVPKRLVSNTESMERSMKLSDMCSLIGNSFTLNTYPAEYRSKIHLVAVSASYPIYQKRVNTFVPNKSNFLWFFGGGAVHKGLDLVIEAFAKNPKITLHIIGGIETEKDFMNIYQNELTNLPNIKYHGYLLPTDKKFIDIINNVFCFIAPSCSESISTAVATCLQIGLFPIITRETGVTLPHGCGIYLESGTIEEIEQAVAAASKMNAENLNEQIELCQSYALKQFSREKFSEDINIFITEALNN